MNESEIFIGLKEHDERAFEMLFNLLYPQVRYFTEQITRNELEAEDITMQSFLVFVRKGIEQFNSYGELRSFLFRAARNAAFNYLKKHKVQQTHERNLVYLTTQAEEINAEKAMYKVEMLQVLHNEIDKLPQQTKEVFKLVFVENMPRPLVAQKLNIAVSTVNNHCANAKAKLRQVFTERELIVLLLVMNVCLN